MHPQTLTSPPEEGDVRGGRSLGSFRDAEPDEPLTSPSVVSCATRTRRSSPAKELEAVGGGGTIGALVVIDTVAGFESVVPAACEQEGFTSPSAAEVIQANGDPAVVGQVGQETECRCTDVVGRGTPEDAFLVERRRGRERQGKFVVPHNGRNAVGGGDGGEVHAVRGQPCQFPAGVLKHSFDLDAVPGNACAERHAPASAQEQKSQEPSSSVGVLS